MLSANTRLRVAVATALAGVMAMPEGAEAAPTPQAGALEEIVVTARRREESLQEVPIAVTAFSSAALQSMGMRSLEDIALRTPGLQFSEQAGQIAGRFNCSIRFRGMNVNSEQAVYQLGALFIDGIYVASGCSGTGSEDLERVEVIKGPQAVYFGRNTFGGAVNYVTKDPGNEWGGKVSASAAEDDDYEYTGSIEGPIVRDKLYFRLTGRYYDRGGIFVSNFGDELGEQKTRSAALKLVATPTENFTIRARAFYGEDRDGPSAGGFISGILNDTCTGTTGPNGEVRRRYICGEIPGINSAVTANNGSLISYNTSLTANAFMPGLQLPSFTLVNYPEFLRTQLLENGANDPAIDDALNLDFYGLKRNNAYIGAVADYDFANGMRLTGTYGYNKMRANWLRDFDFTDVESWWSTDPQNLEDDYYELRLTSDQSGKLTWVVGASYYEMEYTQSGNGGTAVTAVPVCIGAPPGTCTGAPPQPPAGVFFAYLPSTFRNSLVNNVDQTYTAVFGGVTYKFSDQWSLSVEARWQEDELEKGQAIGPLITPDPIPATNVKWDDVLPRVILQWQPTAQTNLYASFSQGVLPGDINAEYIYAADNMRTNEQVESARDQIANGADPYPELGLPTGSAGLGDQAQDVLDREKLDSYEIGWKQSWLDGRISTAMAVYYMEWENQKGRVSAPVVDFNGNTNAPYERDPVGCAPRSSTSLTCNDTLRTLQMQIPGFSELKGVEFEGTWSVNDNLTLQAGLEWTDNEYTDFTFNFVEQLAGTSDMEGNSSPRYPEWKGNIAASYEAALGGTGWDWFGRLDYIYFGDYYVDESNLASAPEQNLVNARVGITNGNTRVELFGMNLTDEEAYAAAGRWSDFSIPGNFNFPANQGVVVTPQRPRYFGLRVSYTF